VIERPLSVSRVAPPTTTIARTRAATAKSQMATARERSERRKDVISRDRALTRLNLGAPLARNRGAVYERPMSERTRKLIGLLGVMVFLAAYIVAMTLISDHIPDHWAARLAFYVVAGIGRGVPNLPLISWMNTGRWRR
jgi:hypothetical protein